MAFSNSHRTAFKGWCGFLVLGFLALQSGVARAESGGAHKSFARTIYLVRHGAYIQDDKADPELGPGITPLGVTQARLVAARLAGMPTHFASMTSSTMTRAWQTAVVMQQTLKIAAASRSTQLTECTPPAFRRFEGETREEQVACAQRLDAAYAERFVPAAGADRVELVVAHGNVIRYFVTKALGIDTRAWFRLLVAHASLTVIRVNPDGSTTVLGVGDVGHIPPNLQSGATDENPELTVPAAVR